MNGSPCTALDDYLNRDLTGDDLAQFTAHLPACGACRHAVREQERLAALLSEAVQRLEPVPQRLVQRIEGRIRVARRRRLAALGAALAAAAVVVWLIGKAVLPQGEREQVPATTPP